MSVIKTYNVKVHRKISEGVLVEERPRDSIVSLETTEDKKIDYKDELYTTKLISVKKYNDRTEIKANTLGLKISNKIVNNKWLYNYVVVTKEITPENLGIIDEYLIEDSNDSRLIYFNNSSNTSFINYLSVDYLIHPCVLINNSIDKSDYVEISRNADHILITINTTDTFNVELLSNYIFYPKIYNNTLEFNECVFKYNGEYIHLYTHTLTETERKEFIALGKNLKRPVYRKNSLYYSGSAYVYNSYNSNLLFLTSNLDTCYFYLKLNSTDISNILVVKDSLVEYEDMVLLFTINNTTQVDRVNINPLYTNVTNEPIGENIIFNDKSLSTSKYSDIQNIPIGKTLYNIDIEDIVNGYKNTLLVGEDSQTYIRYGKDNTLSVLPTFDITTIQSIPTKYKTYSSTLDTKLKLILGIS